MCRYLLAKYCYELGQYVEAEAALLKDTGLEVNAYISMRVSLLHWQVLAMLLHCFVTAAGSGPQSIRQYSRRGWNRY